MTRTERSAFQLVLPADYPVSRKAESIEAVLRATRAVPGVAAAGFAYAGLLVPVQNTVGSFVPPGQTLEAVSRDTDRPRIRALSAGYLEAAGATLLSGRLIRETDVASAPTVAVINGTVRRRYLGDADPVGAFMEWHGGQAWQCQYRLSESWRTSARQRWRGKRGPRSSWTTGR